MNIPPELIWNVLLLAAAAVGILVLLWVSSRLSQRRIKQVARQMFARNKAVYSERHEYAVVERPQVQFGHLDLDWYDSIQRELEGEGFRWLQDLQNVTVCGVFPHFRTFVRSMTDRSGTSVANISHIKNLNRVRAWRVWIRTGLPRELRVVEFETEFEDRTFLCTSNAVVAARTAEFLGIERHWAPADARWEHVLRQHQSLLAQRMRAPEEKVPVVIRTEHELIASSHRQQELKNRSRKNQGYFSGSDVYRIAAGSKTMTRGADVLAPELEKLSVESRAGKGS